MTNISPGTEHENGSCVHCTKEVELCTAHPVRPCHIHKRTRLHICDWTSVPTTVATPRAAA